MFKMDEQIIEEVKDKQVKERPRCQVEGCKNDALVLIGNMFVCGEHVLIFEKNKNKVIQSMFQDDHPIL